MALAMGVTASAYAANPFSDVPAGHWAYDSISNLVDAGVIEGYPDGSFGGDKLMTRYEMAQIVAKAMAKGANVDRLAAEFADELDALGVRVAALEKKADNVKITGKIQAQYRNGHVKTDGTTTKKVRSRLRSRLNFTGAINDDWSYYATLENIQKFHDESTGGAKSGHFTGEENTKFRWAHIEGRLGGFNVVAGSYSAWIADGNVYDTNADAIDISYGSKVKIGGFYGKPTGLVDDEWFADGTFESFWGARLAAPLGDKVKATAEYTQFEGKGKNKDAKVLDVALNASLTKDLGLGAMYLHTNDSYVNKGASKNGFVANLTYKGASFKKAGTYGLEAKYYMQPGGSALAHTMDGSLPKGFFGDGFKGYKVGANYAVAKNMVFSAAWYDLKNRENSSKKAETIWSELQIRF